MSKRVNLKAIQFDGDATQPGGVNTANSDLAIMSDQDVFTWSDSTSLTTGQNHKPFTMSCWFNPSANADPTHDHGTLIGKFSSVTNGERATEWLFMVKNRTGQIHFALYDTLFHHTVNKITTTSASVVTNNQWQHAVVTFNGNPQNFDKASSEADPPLPFDLGYKIYYNGQAVNTTEERHNFDGENAQGQVSLGYVITRNTAGVVALGGAHYDSTGTPDNFDTLYEGKIADTCIFNKELSAAEVQELYNNGKVKDMTKHSAYDSLISWWKMGDDLDHSGTNGIIDYVSGFHGTLHGQASIVTDPSLPTDRIRLQNHAHSSWGRTRQPKNLVGDHQIFVHGGLSGNMPKTDPSAATDGYPSENQRYLHTYWKAEQTNKTHEITVFGYSYAMGTWSLLHDVSGNQIKLNTANAAVDQYKIFEISGVDRIYFKSTGADDLLSTDLFAAAASSM